MQEGDTELGGLQIPHGNNVNPPTPTPGPQPVASAAPQNSQPVATAVQPANFESLQNTQNIQSITSTQYDNTTIPPTNNITWQTSRLSTSNMLTSDTPFVNEPNSITDLPHSARKKKWMIGLGLLCIIVITCIGIFLASGSIDNTERKKTINIIDAFNTYANYTLYGEDSNSSITDFDVSGEYVIDRRYMENEFLEKCKTLFETFSEDFVKSDYIRKTNISLYNTNEYYDFLIQRNSLITPNEEELLKIYTSEGAESADAYINNYYTNVNQDNYLIGMLTNYYKEYMKYLVEEWKVYDSAGCRENGSYSIPCIEKISSNEINDLSSILGNLEMLISHSIVQPIESIKNQIWQYRMAILEENYDMGEYDYVQNEDNIHEYK